MNKSGYHIVTENGLCGLEDSNGRKVVPCEYDKILDYDDDGYIRLLKGDVYSTITITGEEAIPLSLGLTHLGVFWNGTARARKGDGWGLVDENGNTVTEFTFTQMGAHRNNGYFAVDKDGVKGWLLEDGRFSPFKNQDGASKKKPYKEVRVYHADVAPALTWERTWVFVDRELNRVNDISYDSMDPVLRDGIYYVCKTFGANRRYSMAYYDGRLVIDAWFDGPMHFEGDFALCHKLQLDENDNKIILPKNGGQPLYSYGILQKDGTWLFPMDYSNICWNDYKEKDCWYAEDDKACYLLYPDGSRKIYDKSRASRSWYGSNHIPVSEMGNDIPEEALRNTYIPQMVVEKYLSVFDTSKFESAMLKYIDEDYTPRDYLQVYYRDTDATFDIDANYKVGQVLRAGDFMEATKKLGRPVHKVRFMIIATTLFSIKEYMDLQDNRNLPNPFPFQENIIHRNSYFVVVDIFRYAGKTQIMLLKIPHGAYVLADRHGWKFDQIDGNSDINCLTLSEYARKDFKDKMQFPVHGHSLDEAWSKAMYQPIGLDKSMMPVDLAPDYESPMFDCSYGTRSYCMTFERFYNITCDDHDNEWQETYYMKTLMNPIKVVVGDITRLRVDAIVNAANRSLLGGGGVDGAIHRAAGSKLLEECMTLNGCDTGQSKITKAYELPCKKVIHTVGPVWHGGDCGEDKLLASCYSTALDLALANDIRSIAFPCISTGVYRFPKARAARIAIQVISDYLSEGKYKGDVTFCCFSAEDAEYYKQSL